MSNKKIIITSIAVILLSFIILSFRIFSVFSFYSPHLYYLLGQNKPTTYLFLLGNDTEARANGGFAGSYTKIIIDTPSFDFLSFLRFEFFRDIKLSVSFHDIYVPNGQLSGHVKPPEAIQQAFGKGTWELANADYDPHFPTSATSIRWFLEKGKESNPDILGIVNLSTIKKVLNVIGEFKLLENDKTITPDNLYLYLQGKAEVNFFPGSTQKADALHSVGTAILKKIHSLSFTQKIKIAKIIFQDLKNQNIVLNSTDPAFQKFLESQKFAGAYQADSYDYYGLVEMNLGANKANQYVSRQTTHTISTSSPSSNEDKTQPRDINHQVTINFQNTSPEKNPNPPIHYGGHYIGYFRIYLPPTATNILLTHSQFLPCQEGDQNYCYDSTSSANVNQSILEKQTPTIAGDNTVNFWHITLAGQHSSINLSYNLPPTNPQNYSLTILKQNGFPSSPQTVNIFGTNHKTNLESNFFYPK